MRRLIRTLFLSTLAATGLAVGLLRGTPAHAQGQICRFETNEAHYASLTSPPERLVFEWDRASGAVVSFQWINGPNTWFPYAADPGQVTEEFNYRRLDLGITTTGFEDTRYSIKGYLATNVQLPAVTFAGIYEGTGTAWFVGYGNLTCM
jgi:hypothetical protein